MYKEALGKMFEGLPSQEYQSIISELVRWLFAAAAGGWMIMMVLNGTAAQSLLTRMGKNIRPAGSGSVGGLDLPVWLLAALAVATTVAWTWQSGGAFGKAWLIVFALPFTIHSLVRMHGLSRLWPGRFFSLTAFYGVVFSCFRGA